MERLDPEVQFTKAVTHKMNNKEEVFSPRNIPGKAAEMCISLLHRATDAELCSLAFLYAVF